jgi:selenocysteine lyase/cysteine desulfurase
VVATLNEAVESWRTGRAEAADYDALVDRARRRFAGLVEVPPDRVAIGNQVSTFTGLVAAALPDGACVLAAEEDFTSVLFPFLAHADRGVRVETVPLDRLVERIRPGVSLVAVSAVQSADGRLVPGGLDALASAAAAHGSLTYVDASQAVGWLPFDAGRFDFVSCAAYKWLVSPRGTAFGVVRPERLEMLRPLFAGWYAGDDPWTSIYGPPLRLAKGARRLDISPAWLAWAGTLPALDLLSEVGIAAIHRHDLDLANKLRARLGLPPGDSAIVTVSTNGGLERLRAADIGRLSAPERCACPFTCTTPRQTSTPSPAPSAPERGLGAGAGGVAAAGPRPLTAVAQIIPSAAARRDRSRAPSCRRSRAPGASSPGGSRRSERRDRGARARST